MRLHGNKSHRDLEMLVDTGAIYTKIPESLAKELGIVPDEVVRVKLADGTLGLSCPISLQIRDESNGTHEITR